MSSETVDSIMNQPSSMQLPPEFASPGADGETRHRRNSSFLRLLFFATTRFCD